MWLQDLDEKTRYVFVNYQHLMTPHESAAYKSFIGNAKSEGTENQNLKAFYQKRLISQEPEVISLYEMGFVNFAKTFVERLIKERGNEVFMNYCPKCSVLARTPKAKQCPKCFYSWHEED